MTSMRKIALACMTAAMVTMSVNAGAQSPANQDTFFTFSQAVELPKTTLPAGTYFFQLMDSPGNRHVVKVMSQDRKQIHATLMAIPFYSNERPPDDPQVRFMETPAQAGAAQTNAIKVWFYPGNSVGHEFIYPRAQAMQIAARTNQPVLTTRSDGEVVADAELSRVDGSGIDSEANLTAQASPESAAPQAEPAPQREPVGAITGTPERTTPEATPAPERVDAPARTDLPNTAGSLPLLALLGIGAIVGSRLMRRSRA
jgi:hypothetical protein